MVTSLAYHRWYFLTASPVQPPSPGQCATALSVFNKKTCCNSAIYCLLCSFFVFWIGFQLGIARKGDRRFTCVRSIYRFNPHIALPDAQSVSGQMSCRVVWRQWDGEQNGIGMSRRLKQITDWPERAAEAQWCVNNLAVACGVSLTQMERHFHETWGQCPRAWLQSERMRRACELLKRRERIKDIAEVLCYGHQRNFTTAFTKFYGYPPSMHRKKIVNGGLKMAGTPSPPRTGRAG